MNAYNIVADDAEFSFMVIASNRTLLTWMRDFLRNENELKKFCKFSNGATRLPKECVSRMCVDRFIVGCCDKATCYEVANALQDAVTDALQRHLIPEPNEPCFCLDDALKLIPTPGIEIEKETL